MQNKPDSEKKLTDILFEGIAEQKQVESYVKTKVLERPKSGVISILILLLTYLAVSFFVGRGIIGVFDLYSYRALVYALSYVAGFILIAKGLCKKAVLCYQRYAKESTRRKCLCMPTCSEYALLVLEKYCLIKALHLIRKRLFITCRGGVYKKDFP